jgi:hypothetical protein
MNFKSILNLIFWETLLAFHGSTRIFYQKIKNIKKNKLKKTKKKRKKRGSYQRYIARNFVDKVDGM